MATLSDITPDFVYEQETKFDVLVSRFENLTTQRRLKTTTKPKKFKLVFVNRPRSDYEYLQSFLEDRGGGYESFTWNNKIDSQDYTVVLVDKSFKVQWRRFNSYNFELVLEEDV